MPAAPVEGGASSSLKLGSQRRLISVVASSTGGAQSDSNTPPALDLTRHNDAAQLEDVGICTCSLHLAGAGRWQAGASVCSRSRSLSAVLLCPEVLPASPRSTRARLRPSLKPRAANLQSALQTEQRWGRGRPRALSLTWTGQRRKAETRPQQLAIAAWGLSGPSPDAMPRLPR